MEYIKYKSVKSPFIAVAWALGSVCNYSCSYCIPVLYDGKIKFPDYKPFLDFTDKLKEKYPGQKIQVTMYGGETTLWKDFKVFLKESAERDVFIRIVSNGSRSIEWWKSVAHKINHSIISFHPEYAKEDHITEVLKLFMPGRSQMSLMVPHDRFDEMLELGKRISENAKVFVIPKFLRKQFGNELYPYTEEQLETFKKYASGFGNKYLKEDEEFKHKGLILQKEDGELVRFRNARQLYLDDLNRWEGWKCWGGIESLFVDEAGEIFSGQCREGRIGNINEAGYVLPDEPIICGKDSCNCTQDILEAKKEKV